MTVEMAGSSNASYVRPSSAKNACSRLGGPLDQDGVSSKTQQLSVLTGPVAILWDIENCPVPSEVNAEDVAGNIRMALRVHPAVKGAVTMFSAYGDFNHFPRRLRTGCQRTGVNLIDVPNGRKDAADKAILVDMFLFALDNSPPSTILLISGDVDFAPALHKLGQRGYTVVLAIPAGVGVSSALCNAGRFVWDWPSVARGEGLVPAKAFLSRSATSFGEDRFIDLHGYPMGTTWFSSDDSDLPNEDDPHAYWRYAARGCNQELAMSHLEDHNKFLVAQDVTHRCDFAHEINTLTISKDPTQVSSSTVPSSQDMYQGQISNFPQKIQNQLPSNNVPAALSAVTVQPQGYVASKLSSSVESTSTASWVQPGDIQSLKGQLVKLLKNKGGKLMLDRIPAEYSKLFGRPLYLAEYGSTKLVRLIDKMQDAFSIKGEGSCKALHLKDSVHASSTRHRRARGSTYISGKEGRDKNKVERLKCLEKKGPGQQECQIDQKNEGEQLLEDVDDSFGDVLLVQESEGGSDDDDQQEENREDDGLEIEQFDVNLEEYGNAEEYAAEVKVEVFRQELQELLVSHACKILMTNFSTLYQQRYSRDLDLSSFGVDGLEALIEKVSDVVVMKEELGTKRKFLVAKCAFQLNDFR